MKGANVITNGSFDDGVDGWFAAKWEDAAAENYTLATKGGFDNGAYLQYSAGGVGAATNIRGKWAVESGKTYLFRCYTSGKAPASNNLQYSFLKYYSETADNNEGALIYQLVWGAEDVWTENAKVFTATSDMVVFRSSWTENSKLDGFFLGEVERGYTAEQYQAALEAAQAALADEAYANIVGAEKEALKNAISTYASSTAYKEATMALENATENFTAAKASYDAYAVEVEHAKSMNVDVTAYNVTAATTAAGVDAYVKEMKTAEFVAAGSYPYELSLGAWTTTGKVKEEKKQHWSGDEARTYNEPNSWGDNAGGVSTWAQEVSLPAGSYALKIAGRHSAGSSLKVSIKNGEDVLCVVNDFPAQGAGRGIDVNGEAAFGDEATYANGGAGWGFEWRFLPFELTADGAVQVLVEYESTIGQQWASFCDYVILSKSPKEKAELLSAIAAAKAYDFTANVGTGVFQRNVTIDLTNDIAEAQSVYDTSSDQTEIMNAITTLTTAFNTAKDAFENAELNAPEDGQLFNLILTFFEYQYDNMAVTYIANGRADAGLYNIQYKAEPNTNLAQAFTLTKIEGNNYLLSQIDADGEARYVCTGTVYGGNDSQLRTTTNKEEAAQFTIIATSRDGIYNIFNVAANQYVGSQDQGFFTVNSHIDFKIAETMKAAVLVNTAEAGWGTVMLPFTKAIPEGVKAYTVESVKEDGTSLNLVPAEQLEANKPYLLEGSCNVLFEGDAQGTALTFNNGILTGTYADAEAPVASYVLQNLNSVLGFYLVADEKQPTVEANHAWLTVPEATVKAFLLGSATGVQTVKNVELQNAAIFNLAGQRVNKAQKGIFIQNGKKVVIK